MKQKNLSFLSSCLNLLKAQIRFETAALAGHFQPKHPLQPPVQETFKLVGDKAVQIVRKKSYVTVKLQNSYVGMTLSPELPLLLFWFVHVHSRACVPVDMGGATTHRQAVGFQSGHAASRGGPGVQHVLLRHFELPALWRHVAVPHGHQDGLFIAAIQPLVSLHGRLRPRRVRIQVILEEV